MAHISTLNALSERFLITYLCDVSQASLRHCAGKVVGCTPKTTAKAEELCSSPDVDAVLVCNATAFHVEHSILALQQGKHVFVEKPLALCYRDIKALAEAEAVSNGAVFVGYMRRYAPALQKAMEEIGDISKVQYARVRDIIGPNDAFVNQSATFPKKFSDFDPKDSERLSAKDKDISVQALQTEFGIQATTENSFTLAVLGGLGTHDLSAMREILGVPHKVRGVDLRFPFLSALFDYGGFSVSYESGLNNVPTFDAHIEVYTPEKIVRIEYDTPYIKGLPTRVIVRERILGPGQEISYQERVIRVTYEDSYTVEFTNWHDCIVNGKKPKTSVQDAEKDIDIIKMLMQAASQ